ncbi:MAG: flagellar hook-associated protein 3 [Burkholderiales bacterium 35-55-47]|jgi:flagellar hook-associated protein 3 FlgL|uniref:flagellar hook-associated protein FlgL n=1 Tax=Limnohabitans sp. TaxID=1907725 RepID=UPI000BD6DACC|nr:flagellar hook-associated protein FlgL [Limnohabitans sp.]OYY18140.1 MAG: flagellar hook-associated protein 3 [Burkholderiales bacterium 35-55-47]OYZ72553.1 MAG: flagellar hook-associated protein 3 [Burkholderiales bacterium 24-55-52]OZA99985.1 MAG: flagellar hook-associated protein 3 [Burkholderiales bacterium 39-55-53]HQR87051.1 flagellar hook-associated protein FlgL [Limnohabitans sp.]HQS26851.1 flagellar hook-associated protein FlgL [Limnohabitans sp.]
MKISTSLYFDRSTQQLGNVQAKLTKVQEQLSTGLQIVKPSDEPDKASLVTRLESELARQAGYQDTLKAVNVRLTAEETALNNTSNVMYRIKELAVQAANDTLGTQDRQSIALELSTLRDQVLSMANSQDSNGNYLFSGSRSAEPAFSKDADGRVLYQGDHSRMKVNVGDNRRMNLNLPGSDVFTRVVRDDGKGNKVGVDFFQALDDLTLAVKSADRIAMQRGIAEVDTLQNGISEGLGQIGADLSVVDMQNTVLDQVVLRLQTTRSDIEDLDYTEAITRMNKDQLALEAAQSSFAKISQLSLFKFLN